MKKLLLATAATLILSANLFAQNILVADEATGDYYFEEVVQANGLSQAELFKRAKTWILATLKTGDNNITFNEEDFSAVNTGAIKIDKKSFITYYIDAGAFDFKFHVWCKEGRYKYRVDNIMYYILTKDGNGLTNRLTLTYSELKEKKKRDRYLQEQANEKLASFVTLFKQDMTKEASEVKKEDNW